MGRDEKLWLGEEKKKKHGISEHILIAYSMGRHTYTCVSDAGKCRKKDTAKYSDVRPEKKEAS